jgi:hypothetical protein
MVFSFDQNSEQYWWWWWLEKGTYRFTMEPNQEKAWQSHTQTIDFVTSLRREEKCTDVTVGKAAAYLNNQTQP